MKASEVQTGRRYVAKVSGRLTVVELERIEEVCTWRWDAVRARYHVRNLRTGRRTYFRSAAKFRREADDRVTALYAPTAFRVTHTPIQLDEGTIHWAKT